jgi:hypothetical protein
MQTAGKSAQKAALYKSSTSEAPYYCGTIEQNGAGLCVPHLKAKPIMTTPNDVPGTAALAICESLLLALNDHNILPEAEIVGILKDAASAHEEAPAGDKDALHAAVAALIHSILDGGNSVRRP